MRPSIVVEIPCATIYSTLECISSCSSLRSLAASTTALAMECGKCSSMHAAILNNSSELRPSNDTTSTTVGVALVSVPVLSNTIVSASAMASMNFPPLTVTLYSLASLMADRTDTGIESFNAHEKSTISTESALVTFFVNRYTNAVPASVYGTNLSARCSALLSRPDLSFSDFSIIATICWYLLFPLTDLALSVISPSSRTVPAYTYPPSVFLTGLDSPVSVAWLTMPSPLTTSPSNGMTLPIWTTMRSFCSTLDAGISTSVPSLRSQTLSMLSDMLLARSSTDFLCVHSSSSSPISSRNITEPAVAKSPRNTDTPIAVPSRTGTSILPLHNVLMPFHIYLTDLTAVITFLTGTGIRHREKILHNILSASFS